MINYLNELGLESNNIALTGENADITAELAGLESISDLAVSLIDGDMIEQESSINYNKVGLVDIIAGQEGVDAVELLTQLEFEDDFVGVESLKEAGARTWYRVKAAAQGLARAIVAFFKKIVTMGGMTDKAANKLMAKYEKVKDRWNDNISKVRFDSKKKYSTWCHNVGDGATITAAMKTIVDGIAATAETVEGGDIKSFLGKLNDQKKTELMEVLLKKDDAYKKETSKTDKELDKNATKRYTVKDHSWEEYKTAVKNALDQVGVIAKYFEDLEIFAKAKEGIRNAESILKELGSLKADEVAEACGNVEIQKVTDYASATIKALTIIPKEFAKTVKVNLTLADKTFTEVEKLLSNN